MKAKKHFVLAAALLLLAAGGCKEDDIYVSDKFDRPLNAAAPIVKIEGTAKGAMERWMKNTKWEADDDGLLYLIYTSTDSANATDAVKLADISFANKGTATPDPGKTESSLQPFRTSYWDSVDGQRFDYIKLAGGTLKVNSPAIAGAAGKAILRVRDKNRIITEKNDKGEDVRAMGVEWKLADGLDSSIDLAGFEVEPLKTADGHYYVNVVVQLNDVTGPVDIEVSGVYEDMTIAEARGYFGNHYMISDKSRMTVSAFDETDYSQGIEFWDSKVDVTLSSTVGAPLQWDLSDITYYDGRDKQSGTLATARSFNLPQQSYADFASTGTLTPQSQTLQFNQDNSKIFDAVNSHPRYYDFLQSLVANPDGEVDGETNFVTADSYFKSQVTTTIPLWVRITKLTYNETADFDFQDIFDDENIEYVDTLKLKITSDNGMPVRCYAQGFFMADGKAVGELFDDYTLVALTAPLDANDLVTGISHKETIKTLTQADIHKYYDLGVDKIYFDCYVTTEDTEDRFVKIFSHYTTQIKLSVEISSSVK